MTDKLTWFAARLLFESTSAADQTPLLYEERIIVLQGAATAKDAEKKARKLGSSSEVEYESVSGESVSWKFKEVLDLVELDEAEIRDGSEVYHQFLTADEVTRVRESLKAGSL